MGILVTLFAGFQAMPKDAFQREETFPQRIQMKDLEGICETKYGLDALVDSWPGIEASGCDYDRSICWKTNISICKMSKCFIALVGRMLLKNPGTTLPFGSSMTKTKNSWKTTSNTRITPKPYMPVNDLVLRPSYWDF